MSDPGQIVVGLLWAGIIAAWLAYAKSTARSHFSTDGGCSNCGAALDRPARLSATGRDGLCNKCFGNTRRHYRIASWFFLGLASLYLALSPVVGVAVYRRSGAASALGVVAIILAVSLVVAIPGWLLRKIGRGVERLTDR